MNDIKQKLIKSFEKHVLRGCRMMAVEIARDPKYNWLTPIDTMNYCSGYLDGAESVQPEIDELEKANYILSDAYEDYRAKHKKLRKALEAIIIDLTTGLASPCDRCKWIYKIAEYALKDKA